MMKQVAAFLPFAALITLTCGFCYFLLQQNLRQSANDPQVQLAKDVAHSLVIGMTPQNILPQGHIDISQSFAPFVIIYDKDGNVVGSTAELNAQTPVLPKGVFASTKARGEDRITWQPVQGVRIAAVIRHYSDGKNSGFVLAGKSLVEVERREDTLGQQVFLGWMTILLGTFIALQIANSLSHKKK